MESPIFIHSLFRAGSTYIFDVFRKSPAGYWCYQEPLHEAALAAKNNPNQLLDINSESMWRLRHPKLDKPYFYELFQVYDQWKDIITKEIIYETYFDQDGNENLIRYLGALIESAKGRPVIQECRTSNRISTIKRQFGGVHIYLWRNPWDQWWSYKTPGFSDAVNQLILNADDAPDVIQRLIEDIGFRRFRSENIYEEVEYYDLHRLSSETSYKVFYTLWCLGIIEAKQHADILLNIDALSDRSEYRQEVLETLEKSDVREISFDDCHVSQNYYTKKDLDFFRRIEDRVHPLFVASEVPQQTIDDIATLRQKFQPHIWTLSVEEMPTSLLLDNAQRVREYVIQIETRESSHTQQFTVALANAEARADQAKRHAEWLETEVQGALTKTQHHAERLKTELQISSARARNAETELQAASAELQAALARAQQVEANAEYLSTVLQAVYQSHSWKITYPLRLLGTLARWFYQGSFAWLTFAPNSRPRRVAKRVFLSAKQEINRYPRLKTLLVQVISRFPRLDERLRKVGQPISPPVIPSLQPEIATDVLMNLTPRARKIYNELEEAIQGKREGN